MKKFTKAGAKFAAAAAVSVMALGYTTSVWAEENKVVEMGKEFAGKTVSLQSIYFSSEKADNVKGIGLDIHDVEKLNIINSDEDGLFIGSHANAYKKGESVGIAVKDAQADFDIKDDLFVWVSGAIKKKEGETGAADVSMRAVGFYGEKGSSQIKAESVSYKAWNEDYRGVATPIEKLNEETLGMDLNNYTINIFAKKNIEIFSSITNKSMLTGEKTAQSMVLNSSKASLHADENINILAAVGYDVMHTRAMPAISFGPVIGIYADSSELDMQAGGQIKIEATINGSTSNNNLAAINAKDSKINMKAEQGIEIKAANGNAIVANNSKVNIKAEQGIEIIADNGYAIVADKQSEITLDSGSSGISINGNVNVLENSVLKLLGQTTIGGDISNLKVDDSTLVVGGFRRVSGSTTLNKAKIYLYDDNNTSEGFHALSIIGDLNISRNNELFLRADSSKAAGDITRLELNSDFIGIGGAITGDGKFNVNVFDKGMKNGYGMGTDGPKDLTANPITVLYSRDSTIDFTSLINSKKVNVNDMHYDNGIWNYAYIMDAEQDGKSLVIKNVKVKAQASDSQRSLHSANKAAGALAIGVLGNDNALHAHLREAQGAGEREEVWAQYLGGKLKSDGMQLKHNGVELGYDAYVGSNWTFGVSGMQTRGNTQLDSGSGKAKTNVGTVYGAWHGGSTYLNLEAKAGRVSSESKTFGGTVLQKIAGEFSAPAYSVSAEYGSTHELPAAWYLEPAVRLSYVHLGAADYGVQVKDTLARVANDSLDSFILRGGAKLGRRLGAKGSFYVKAAAVYDFGGDLATTVSADGRTAHYEDSLGGWGVEYGAGLEYKLGKAANISLDVERRSGGELKRDWGVNIGVNYSF